MNRRDVLGVGVVAIGVLVGSRPADALTYSHFEGAWAGANMSGVNQFAFNGTVYAQFTESYGGVRCSSQYSCLYDDEWEIPNQISAAGYYSPAVNFCNATSGDIWCIVVVMNQGGSVAYSSGWVQTPSVGCTNSAYIQPAGQNGQYVTTGQYLYTSCELPATGDTIYDVNW
jgi:hypothetical protein